MELRPAPSKEAAVLYVTGQPKGLQKVIGSMVKRTFLIGTGIALLGDREYIFRNSMAGSIAIELYLLWYYSNQLKK